MSSPTAATPTPAASAMKMLAVHLHLLVAESTMNGFAKARARSWKDFLFDRRTAIEKSIDEMLKDTTNTDQCIKVEMLAEQIIAAIKAEVAYQVKVQLAGREGGHGHP